MELLLPCTIVLLSSLAYLSLCLWARRRARAGRIKGGALDRLVNGKRGRK